MSLPIGTVIEMTRDAPYKEYGVYKGDIGVINYVAKTGKYSVHIYGKSNPHLDAFGEDRKYGKQGDFWIPYDYVKRYTYKKGDRVTIISKTSMHKGYLATVRDDELNTHGWVQLYVDGTDYQPETYYCRDKYLTLAGTSISLVYSDKEGEMTMKLSGFNKVAVIEICERKYHFALYDDDIVVGDKVLVSGRMAAELLTIKDIITVDEAKEKFKGDIVAEVKCKVDLSSYEHRVKNREEAAKLRKKMDEEIKKMDELNKYEMYAASNPVLKEMLEKFKELGV